ncbi:DUF6691 family protein [Sulfitobacter sabulilitoris]|uniref:YeeE/YedE family protein n=1 Tax=Sulfitobacter sabulilitoris TaxID=2562655 RepID=A0A5S3PIC0_9RHOB|nr:DUF6691 family protein [Sulfitobacter sabulilitoris]TMM54094.1 hypothetical protein FDT80_00360 [Sulfitobacter sabulilitoris]
MRRVIALIAGGLFGAGLHLSGMTDTTRVLGFLDIFGDWDPTLMFVMGGAILPMALAWRLTIGRAPATGGSFPTRPDPRLDPALLAGGLLFGIGWGLVGLCPGPAIASLSYGQTGGIVFFVSMLAGMIAAPPLRARLDSAARRA